MSLLRVKRRFAFISKKVWYGLENAYNADISIRETTISDLLFLYLHNSKLKSLTTIPTPHNKESEQGTDWEFWIGREKQWLRYAVQAKKYNTKKNEYSSLNHSVMDKTSNKKRKQYDILAEYAKANEAIPIYALYNYIDLGKKTSDKINHYKFLNMLAGKGDTFDDEWGVAITPLHNVQLALNNKGCRNLYFLRSFEGTMPLHELIDVTNDYLNGKATKEFIEMFQTTPKVYEQPAYYFNNNKSKEFHYIQTSDAPFGMPKWILIINIGEQNESK